MTSVRLLPKTILAVRPRLADGAVGLLLLLPAVVGLLAFVVGPMVANVWISFHDERLTTATSPWVGLRNWDRLLTDGSLLGSLGLTLAATVVSVVGSTLLGLGLAVFLMDRPLLRRSVGTVVLLPIATSVVIASVGWKLLFDLDGGFNQALAVVGIHGPNWLDEPMPARAAIIVVGLWAQAGFALLLYQAALAQLPRGLADAGRLYDAWTGAGNKLRLLVPLLHRTTVLVIVVSTIIALRSFDQVYALTRGGPDGDTRTLAFLSWQRSFQFFNLGEGAVAATLLIALVLVVVAVELLWLRRSRPRTETETAA